MNPDRLAELEEERRFLLRSLDDLEREHAAGDIDDVDYALLKDGYTARAAATMRQIDEGEAALPAKRPPNWKKRGLIAVGVVAAVGVVWWALAASSAQRLPGQEITGFDPRTEQQLLLAQARSLQAQDPGRAAELYALVLADDPDNVEAMTYGGWTLVLSSRMAAGDEAVEMLGSGEAMLATAVRADPSYPDPVCLFGVVQFAFRDDAETAKVFVDRCLALNPPADVRELVEGLAADVDERLDGSDTATTAP